jgi:hypothetical protein
LERNLQPQPFLGRNTTAADRCDDDDFGVKYWLLRFSRSVHADFLTIEEMGLRMLAELKGLRGGNP